MSELEDTLGSSGAAAPQGFAVSACIEEWAIHHPDPQMLLNHRNETIKLFLALGWHINENKSEFSYLERLSLDTKPGIMGNVEAKLGKMAPLTKVIVARAENTLRAQRSIIEKRTSATPLVTFGKANTRQRQWLLESIWCHAKISSRHTIELDSGSVHRTNLAWAKQHAHMNAQMPDVTIHTHARENGWEAVVRLNEDDGFYLELRTNVPAVLSTKHNNVWELQTAAEVG
jgi:hypothetical protein